jgi:hypothetical protein
MEDEVSEGHDARICWGAEYGKIFLDKRRVLMGYPCCTVLAYGYLTDRCWVCNEKTGWLFDRISYRHTLKTTNPYKGATMKPGDDTHLRSTP